MRNPRSHIVGRVIAFRERSLRAVRGFLCGLGPFEGIFVWILTVGGGSLAVVSVFFYPWLTDMFEVCNELHESADTPYGWTVACGSMALSLVFARLIGSRAVMWFAWGSLPLHWLTWHWLLIPRDPTCVYVRELIFL